LVAAAASAGAYDRGMEPPVHAPPRRRAAWPLLAAAAALLAVTSTPADAHGRAHPRARVGVYIGPPVVVGSWWWHRPPPYYYYPPPVVVREIVREPLVFYDERGNPLPPGHHRTQPPPPAQPQSGAEAPAWFFCPDSQTYYPYVQNCASPWQRVAPHPPPPPQ
jgi:hypothetical protein